MPEFFADVVDHLRQKLSILDAQQAVLDRRRESLETALSALQESSPGPVLIPPVSPSVVSEDEEPVLAQRVLGVLRRAGPLPRARLVEIFRESDVNPSTLDSALYRLKHRGVVGKRGRAFFVVSPAAALESSGAGRDASLPAQKPSSGSPPVAPEPPLPASGIDPNRVDPPPVGVEAGRAGTVPASDEDSAHAASAPPAASADGPSNREQVFDALVALGPSTRRALVGHLGTRGIQGGSVDTALKGLRSLTKVERRADGVYVVVSSDATSSPPDAS